MDISPNAGPHYRPRLYVALVAILTSVVIAALVARGVVNPYPNVKLAYLICVAVGVFGLMQLVIAIASGSPGKSLARTRDG